jgi:hypothetical protein
MRHARIAALALALLLPFTAIAATYEEIVALVDAKTPAADIVTAVNATTDPFLPRHVYGLIDKEAPPEVMIGEPHAAENGSHPLPEAELAQVQAEQSSEPKAESDEPVRTDGPADDETRQSHHFPESSPR